MIQNNLIEIWDDDLMFVPLPFRVPTGKSK